MDNDSNENFQKTENGDNDNIEVETRFNESNNDVLGTDEHSITGDIEGTERTTEIIRLKDEFSERTSIDNDIEIQEQETDDNDIINVTDASNLIIEETANDSHVKVDENEVEQDDAIKSNIIKEDAEIMVENLSTNRDDSEEGINNKDEDDDKNINIEQSDGIETNRDEGDEDEIYREEEGEDNKNEAETNRGKVEEGEDVKFIRDDGEEDETIREQGDDVETNKEDETNREEGEEGETNREGEEDEIIREEREDGEIKRDGGEEEINIVEDNDGENNNEEGEDRFTNREEGEEIETNREEDEEGETNREEGEEVETNREEDEEGETNREEGEEVETNREEGEEGETNREEGDEVATKRQEGEEVETNREEGVEGETNREEDVEVETNREEVGEVQTLIPNETDDKENNEQEHGESHFGINKSNQINDGRKSNLHEIVDTEFNEIPDQTNEKFSDITKERKPEKNDEVSNFFTAPVTQDDGTVKHQLVTIVRSKGKKQFLGGFRHKVSGVVYHHASVQTMPKPRPPPAMELFSRDTQTFQLKHQKVNTDSTTSTQMTQPGLYVANVNDKLLPPKQYETADEYRERLLENIIIIQKYYRRWLAKQVVDEKRKQRDDRLQWEDSEKDRKQKEKEERIKKEYQRRMHPKTKADFDLLYNDLEKWREEQLLEIHNSDISDAERKARKAVLLEEETDLLAAIDRHKLDRKEETKTESVQRLLSKAAAPKTWKDPKGRKIEMNTQFTIRSQELLEIFNSLNMQYLTSDERLDVLLTLKHTVKEHDCKLTKDIVDLVDREADLIMRNVKEASLAGLRKRIATLFLQYCKTPTFNPQISTLLKVPADSSQLVGDINYCKYCGHYLRSTEFSLSTKSSKLGICKSCARKDNQSRNRQDYSHYRRILKEIQMNEQQINDDSKVAFIFKQNDVKSLIESVWDGKSVISGCDDLDELMFIRWDSRGHWSPWNTIFLTKDEAEAHVKVTSLSDTYSNVLINRITQKHVIAKNMFGSLEKMIDNFQSRIVKVSIKA